jgi:hypothetical protein
MFKETRNDLNKKKGFANTGTVFLYFSGHGHKGHLMFHKKGLKYTELYKSIREEIEN